MQFFDHLVVAFLFGPPCIGSLAKLQSYKVCFQLFTQNNSTATRATEKNHKMSTPLHASNLSQFRVATFGTAQ